MGRLLILGGTGQIGRATARAFLADGWEVTLAGRDAAHMPPELAAAGARFTAADRGDDASLAAALGEGADVVLDCIAFTAEDAQRLIRLRQGIGLLVAVSSASVYRDAAGRSLDEATGADDFPRLRVPIYEGNPTVPAGDATYSTSKVAVEQALLGSDLRTTVLRPCAIHGPGTRFSREWHFVKRVLDGRRVVVLAERGASRFHTTAVENLAELVRLAARRPARRVLNCGDPEPPTVAEISRVVSAALDHEFLEVLLPGAAPSEALSNPWAVPRPFVVGMATAEIDVGYKPVTTYARSVEATCRWLVEATAGRDWREVLPRSARHMRDGFDYPAEDEFLRELAPS